jgi:ABC-type multidrug transport system ATPase subunit
VRVLEEVTLDVKPGETVVLLGTNGNGKSTLMKCIMGIVRPRSGRIMAAIDGVQHDLTSLTTEQIVDLGIALVPEGRRLFPKLPSRKISRSARSGRPPAPRSSTTSKPASRPSRGSPSARASSPARCRAASSRCWRSAAR